MEATLTVYLDQRLGTISHNLYGLRSAEVFKNETPLIWVGENSLIPNIDGIRADTVKVLKRIAPGYITAGGGIYQRWQDGIGPREQRPVRVNYFGRSAFEAASMEWRNDFGTDEIVRFCRLVGAEPLLMCNEEDPAGSRDWVEYCNYDGDSYYTRLRKANGHPEPYHVNYWSIASWTDLEPEEAAANFRRFAAPVRALDPTVKLIANEGGREWNQRYFDKLNKAMSRNFAGTDLIDYLWTIGYTAQNIPEVDYTDEQYYRVLHNCAQEDGRIRELDSFLSFYDRDRTYGKIEVSGVLWLEAPDMGTPTTQLIFDWGTLHFMKRQTLREAIAHAAILDIFHQWPHRVTMAALFLNMVIQSAGDRIILTPTYHLFDMYRPHRGNESVAVEIDCPRLQGEGAARALSSSASVSADDSEVVISITNRHLTEPLEVKVAIPGKDTAKHIEMKVLTSKNLRDLNDAANPDRVHLRTVNLEPGNGVLTVSLEPFSVNVLQLT